NSCGIVIVALFTGHTFYQFIVINGVRRAVIGRVPAVLLVTGVMSIALQNVAFAHYTSNLNS
ncbi:MAG: hypothetical protein ACRC2I_12005, partial [Plesiomonas shigelloides]